MLPYSNEQSSLIGNRFEEIQIPVPWGQLSGKWWGRRDAVPLLGLHGFLDSAGSFDRLAPLLDVPAFLALDFPGHGRSSHLPRGAMYQFADFVLSVRLVVKHFGWKRVSLVGHSFGSGVCLAYAASYPEEVGSFVSLDCGRFVLPLVHAKGSSLLRMHVEMAATSCDVSQPQLENATAYKWEDLVARHAKASTSSDSAAAAAVHLKLILARNVIPHSKDEGYVCLSKDYRLTSKSGTLGCPDLNQLAEYIRRVKCHVLEVYSTGGIKVLESLQRGCSKEIAEKHKEHDQLFRRSAASFERWNITDDIHHFHLSNPERVAKKMNVFMHHTAGSQATVVSRI